MSQEQGTNDLLYKPSRVQVGILGKRNSTGVDHRAVLEELGERGVTHHQYQVTEHGDFPEQELVILTKADIQQLQDEELDLTSDIIHSCWLKRLTALHDCTSHYTSTAQEAHTREPKHRLLVGKAVQQDSKTRPRFTTRKSATHGLVHG